MLHYHSITQKGHFKEIIKSHELHDFHAYYEHMKSSGHTFTVKIYKEGAEYIVSKVSPRDKITTSMGNTRLK